jgi:hypothetical protein
MKITAGGLAIIFILWAVLSERECIKKGQRLEADFDLLEEGTISGYFDTVGRNNGKGLCGDSNFIALGWTRDCFNHDLCQQYTRENDIFELPGGTYNCLDEFIYAIDDFLFSWRCKG